MLSATIIANQVRVSPVPEKVSWLDQPMQAAETLREGAGLVASTQVTGLMGIGSAAWWAAYALGSGTTGPIGPALLTAATAGFARWIGKDDGAVKVFTDYLPKACLLTRSAACRLVLSMFRPAPATTDTGIWIGDGIDVRWSQFVDERLGASLATLLSKEGCLTSYDFGCGQHNAYAKMLSSTAKGTTSHGVDGAISPSTYSIQADLTNEHLNLELRDCVISLEVGAKIPKKYQKQFLDNIVKCAKKVIIISWPTPGQNGPCNGNNPLTNEEVIKELDKRGWVVDIQVTRQVRSSSERTFFWHGENLLFLRPKPPAS